MKASNCAQSCRFSLSMAADSSFDGTVPEDGPSRATALSPLAKRVPRLSKTGDADLDSRNEEHRSALIGVLNHFHRQPELQLPTFIALNSGKITPNTVSNLWPDGVTCVGKLPKFHKAQLLVADSQGRLTHEAMNKINLHDPQAIPQMFQVAVQMEDSFSWPPSVQGKDLNGAVLLLRMQYLNHRIWRLFEHRALKPNGEVDWPRFASHVVVMNFSDGKPGGLRHIGGAECNILAWCTAECSIQTPYSCMQAILKHPDGSQVNASTLYAEGTGPHQCHVKRNKTDQSECFNDLLLRFNEMSMATRPSAVAPDCKYLYASERQIRENAKKKCRDRIAKGEIHVKKARRTPLKREASAPDPAQPLQAAEVSVEASQSSPRATATEAAAVTPTGQRRSSSAEVFRWASGAPSHFGVDDE